MAQVDTGMGWNAKGEWLREPHGDTIGNFSTLGGPLFPNQPIAKDVTTLAECQARGIYSAQRIRYGSDEVHHAAWNDYDVCVFAIEASDHATINSIICVSTTSEARAAYSQGDSYYNNNNSGYPININHDTVTGLYYIGLGGYVAGYYEARMVPVFSSVREGLDAIQVVRREYYKLNSGFAVWANVSFYNTTGYLLNTPVLISTDPDAVVLSSDGTTADPNQLRATIQYDGMLFYMSYVLDITLPAPNGGSAPSASLEQFGAALPSKIFAILASESFANIVVSETTDPYDPFGNSGEDSGPVDPDPEDDDIDEPPLPSMSFHNTGLCRIYRADDIALRQLANYMWTDDTFLQTLVNHAIQLIENPMDAIISLNMVPVAPPDLLVGTAEAVKVMFIPTPAAMWPVLNQFVRIDCGSLQLTGTYGSALDYNPYTKVSCFLPYIGFVDLDTDEVMGKTLSVVYRIDVVTGVCVAMIKVDGDVLYQFSGHCSIQMPLSSADFSGYFGALVEAGKLIAGTAAMAAGAPSVGGMLLDAPAVAEGGSTTTHKTIKTRNEDTNRMRKAAEVTETTERKPAKLSLGELARRQTANTVGAVMNSKYTIEHSGGFSGNSGYMGVRRPFIVVKRPRIANPEQYGQLNGRPSMIYLNLGSCTGYTEVQSVQLTGIVATNPELSEISTLLKSGVIF